MVLRFLVILATIILVRILWGGLRALFGGGRRQPEVTRGPRRARVRGEVVGCARCDLYVPKDQIIRKRGSGYCSRECAAAGVDG